MNSEVNPQPKNKHWFFSPSERQNLFSPSLSMLEAPELTDYFFPAVDRNDLVHLYSSSASMSSHHHHHHHKISKSKIWFLARQFCFCNECQQQQQQEWVRLCTTVWPKAQETRTNCYCTSRWWGHVFCPCYHRHEVIVWFQHFVLFNRSVDWSEEEYFAWKCRRQPNRF